jgi:hypothetical protein
MKRSRLSLYGAMFGRLNEDMSKEDAVKAIKTGIVDPIENESGKAKLEKVVTFLNSAEGKDATVRQLLAQGSADGAPTDESVNVVEGADIDPATHARPTQSQIGLPNSIGFCFTPKGIETRALQAALAGTVIAPDILMAGNGQNGKTFIIDGHHRWSSSIVVNPDVKIQVSLIQQDDPYKALAISQVVIAQNLGPGAPLPSSTSEPGTNLLAMDANAIKQYCIDNVGKVVDPKAGSPFLTDDVLNFLAENGYGGSKASDSRDVKLDKIATQIGLNCKRVPGPGDAPPRAIMPQFDTKVGGPAPSTAIPMFKSGQVNFKDPVVPESHRRSQDEVIMERWQKLAGIIKG